MKNLLLVFCLFFTVKSIAQQGLPVLFSTTTGDIYEVNIDSCTSRFICATGKELFDIAFTPNGKLWGNTIDSLYQIDTIMGNVLPIRKCLTSSALVGLNDSVLVIENAQKIYQINVNDTSTKLVGDFGCFGTDGDFTWHDRKLFITCNGYYHRITFDTMYSSVLYSEKVNDSSTMLPFAFPGLATVYSDSFTTKILAFFSYFAGIGIFELGTLNPSHHLLCSSIINSGMIYGATSMIFPPQPHPSTSIIQAKTDYLNISIYPNPSKGDINLMIDDHNITTQIHLEIYDSYGRLVYKNNVLKNKENISIKDTKPGLYYLRLFNNTHFLRAAKFTIVK